MAHVLMLDLSRGCPEQHFVQGRLDCQNLSWTQLAMRFQTALT